MITIDSNIWAYFFDSTTPEHSRVKKAVEKAIQENEILMTTVVQIELVHYLIKRLGPMLGREKLDLFLNYPFKLDVLDKELVVLASDVLQRYTHVGIGARDASIIASMQRNDVRVILSHDSALARIEEIEVVDPCG